jgi:hypothetical protein
VVSGSCRIHGFSRSGSRGSCLVRRSGLAGSGFVSGSGRLWARVGSGGLMGCVVSGSCRIRGFSRSGLDSRGSTQPTVHLHPCFFVLMRLCGSNVRIKNEYDANCRDIQLPPRNKSKTSLFPSFHRCIIRTSNSWNDTADIQNNQTVIHLTFYAKNDILYDICLYVVASVTSV